MSFLAAYSSLVVTMVAVFVGTYPGQSLIIKRLSVVIGALFGAPLLVRLWIALVLGGEV